MGALVEASKEFKKAYDYASGVCPGCGTHRKVKIHRGQLTQNPAMRVVRFCHCEECGTHWTEEFEMARIRIYNPPDGAVGLKEGPFVFPSLGSKVMTEDEISNDGEK